MKDIRKDFPILTANPKLVYLDSACTSLKPSQVIEAGMAYYREFGACGGRSSHRLGRKTNDKLDDARGTVASFVGGESEGLVWTKNATEALNLVANAFDFSKKRKVVTTIMEHHAVLLPFMKLRDEGKITLEMVPCDAQGEVSMEAWEGAVDGETALVATNSSTNTTGRRADLRRLASLSHDNGALICVDGAQGVPHNRTDMKRDGYDFLCFSGHKMLGPTGIGAMMARKEHLKNLKEFMVGGGTVSTVTCGQANYMNDHTRFEAGIQHYAGIMGLSAACQYLKGLGMDEVAKHEKDLAEAMLKELKDAGATVYGSESMEKSAIYSFNIRNAKAHDVGLMLDKMDIAVRSGFFCAQPGMEAMGAHDGAVRASGYVYNTLDDVKRFGEALAKVKALY
ncbi:aminotransferase class V-fold PLP-dependent enzyme [Candidatus Micrarchaeota archaeon]|nr:aminotransferase class V-fold PLP-dependent enzyme [Candidatus Micrarchaeota archaeon]